MCHRGKIILKLKRLYVFAGLLACIFTFLFNNTAAGQATNRADTARTIVSGNDSTVKTDSTKVLPDSLSTLSDSLKAASVPHTHADSVKAAQDKLGIVLSPDALTDVVVATASDSAVLDMNTNNFHLFGSATVKYQDLDLKANRIAYNQSTSIVTASPSEFDTAMTADQRPSFTQANETVTYDSLQYNFKSKRAIIRNAKSKYGEGYIHMEQLKRNPDQSIFGYRNIYTTCSLDHPHFGIRMRRIKVVPGHIIVAGASNLEIADIPTPIYLPFGLFPITDKQKSGFRIPSYTIEEQRGLGLTNGGYYWHPNDYADLLVLANLYTKGSYLVNAQSTYVDRYHYSGSFTLSYGLNKTGEVYEPTATQSKDFRIAWSHRTDAKATPGFSFTSNVNIASSTYFSNNSYDVNQILNSTYTSNITLQKTWIGKPFSLSINAGHSQNTQTHDVSVTLPQVNFYVSTFNPFARKNPVGSPKWYEKITASYNVQALAQTTFIDSNFSPSVFSLNKMQAGIHHALPVSAAYTVLRFFNVSFNANYNEYWLTQQFYQYYNTKSDALDTVINHGFFAARDFNASATVSTRIYGQLNFKKGKIAAIRHVFTPTVGLNYTPDFARAPFSYAYQTYLTPGGALQYVSPYSQSVVGVPGQGQFGNYSSTVNFGINNNLQMKVRTPKDTATGGKKITLIDALSITSAYNVAADSFKWSGINAAFRTNILNLVNVDAGATFDPYYFDPITGRRTPQTLLSMGDGIARFTSAHAGLTASFHSKAKTSQSGGVAKTDDAQRLTSGYLYNDYVDFNIPWNFNISYSANLTKDYRSIAFRGDTLLATQNVLFSGDFNLTPRWKVSFTSGYDLSHHALTLTQIDIFRDLHCWEMHLNTIPFGKNKSYTFTLNVKASVLQDLKLVRRRSYYDN